VRIFDEAEIERFDAALAFLPRRETMTADDIARALKFQMECDLERMCQDLEAQRGGAPVCRDASCG